MKALLYEYEIFVPATGIPYSKHLAWDKRILELIGGLTLLGKTTGKWGDPNKHEECIRVSIVCTEKDIDVIAGYTKVFFKQEAILVIKRAEAFLY